MALSSETSKQIFVCTGGTVYTVPFYFLQNADLTVHREDADGTTEQLTITTDYTVTGAGSESGGELTTIATYSDGKLIVARDVDYTQRLDLIQGDGFRPDTLEQELDRIVMQVQQLARKVGVSFQLPDSDTSGASTVLPSPEAGKVFAWNATGDALVNEVPQYTVVGNGSITEPKLADGAVTLDKIDADASTADKGIMRFATSAETITGTETDAATTPASVLAAYGRLFKGYHEGLVISTGTDATHDIDISAGICRDSSNASFIQLSSTLTKQIDAAWAAGTNAGGFPSGLTLRSDVVSRQNSTAYGLGAVINPGFGSYWWKCTTAGTTASSVPSGYGEGGLVVSDGSATFTAVEKVFYRVFLIRDVDTGTVDAGFDTSSTAVNLLADATDYTEYRQIGWVLENGTGGIRAFWHVGDGYFLWDVPVENINYSTTMPTSQTAVKITTPPGTIADIKLGIEVTTGTGQVTGLISETRQTDTAPDGTMWNMVMNRSSAGYVCAMCSYSVLTDTSSKIQVRFSGAQKYGISTVGYKYLWG